MLVIGDIFSVEAGISCPPIPLTSFNVYPRFHADLDIPGVLRVLNFQISRSLSKQ